MAAWYIAMPLHPNLRVNRYFTLSLRHDRRTESACCVCPADI
jgi:hypothetical protein